MLIVLYHKYVNIAYIILPPVNKIKQETDVMINIPDNDQGTTIIRIEGAKDGVAKAKKVCSFSKW